ncbi:mariner Mos1 transposase [Trichonephila clavipes]|nr:mariner Mos1 transposase [Trichonephila clavipes]
MAVNRTRILAQRFPKRISEKILYKSITGDERWNATDPPPRCSPSKLKWNRAKSCNHLYDAQGYGQRQGYRARTRDKASHGPIPIPLGYRGHVTSSNPVSLKTRHGFTYERSVYFCVEILEIGAINATRYCDTLSKLKEAIRKKRPELLKYGVLLFYDNARPHSSTARQNPITTLGWERLHHPPYNPNIAPSYFHLFPALMKNLAWKRFGSNAVVKQAVKRFFCMQSPFSLEGFLKFIKRYEKCLNVLGTYMDK